MDRYAHQSFWKNRTREPSMTFQSLTFTDFVMIEQEKRMFCDKCDSAVENVSLLRNETVTQMSLLSNWLQGYQRIGGQRLSQADWLFSSRRLYSAPAQPIARQVDCNVWDKLLARDFVYKETISRSDVMVSSYFLFCSPAATKRICKSRKSN